MSNEKVDTTTIRVKEVKGDLVTISGKAFSNGGTKITMKVVDKPAFGVVGFVLESIKQYQFNNEQRKIGIQTNENDLRQGEHRVRIWAR